MPRGKHPENILRAAQIYAEWIRKPDLPGLAAKYKLTPQRVGQIIANFNPDLETEHERALIKGGLWNLVHEIQQVIDQPGYKLGPNGYYAKDDDGQPVPDVMAKVEAIKVKGSAYKQLAQLTGSEKTVPKQLTVQFDVAHQQMQKDLEQKRLELEEARRAVLPPVVPGEVLERELPPSPAGQNSSEEKGSPGPG